MIADSNQSDAPGRQRVVRAFVRAGAYHWTPKTLAELGLDEDADVLALADDGTISRAPGDPTRFYLAGMGRMTAAPESVRRLVQVGSIALIVTIIVFWLLGLPRR